MILEDEVDDNHYHHHDPCEQEKLRGKPCNQFTRYCKDILYIRGAYCQTFQFAMSFFVLLV